MQLNFFTIKIWQFYITNMYVYIFSFPIFYFQNFCYNNVKINNPLTNTFLRTYICIYVCIFFMCTHFLFFQLYILVIIFLPLI